MASNSTGQGGIVHGWAQVTGGHTEEGLPELRQAMIAYGATAKVMISLYTTMLAEAELGAGSLPQALEHLEAAERLTVFRDQTFWRAGLLHRKGEVLAVQDAAAAEPLLQESLDLAREQQAKSIELRAATGLTPGSVSARGGLARPAPCWRRSSAGSLRASTPAI